jgi:hypothetical protein
MSAPLTPVPRTSYQANPDLKIHRIGRPYVVRCGLHPDERAYEIGAMYVVASADQPILGVGRGASPHPFCGGMQELGRYRRKRRAQRHPRGRRKITGSGSPGGRDIIELYLPLMHDRHRLGRTAARHGGHQAVDPRNLLVRRWRFGRQGSRPPLSDVERPVHHAKRRH